MHLCFGSHYHPRQPSILIVIRWLNLIWNKIYYRVRVRQREHGTWQKTAPLLLQLGTIYKQFSYFALKTLYISLDITSVLLCLRWIFPTTSISIHARNMSDIFILKTRCKYILVISMTIDSAMDIRLPFKIYLPTQHAVHATLFMSCIIQPTRASCKARSRILVRGGLLGNVDTSSLT